jgi:hypothetical protein
MLLSHGSCLLLHAAWCLLTGADPPEQRAGIADPSGPVDSREGEFADWEAAWIDLGGEG